MNTKTRKSISKLPVSHLIRHYLLFAFVVLFLLTLARSAYNLWQFDKVVEADALIPSFLQGLRFDLALIGIVLALPVFLVPLLSISNFTRPIGRFFSLFWLFIGLLLILLLELLTPYFMDQQGLRPDLSVLTAIKDPVELLSQLWSKHLIPAVIGVLLLVLILVAFWSRLESSRFLKFPIRPLPAIAFSIVGLLLCLLAVRSSVDIKSPAMSPETALISKDTTVNEITLNSAYKSFYSLYTEYSPL